jgi:UDP-N-acetylmuramoyl-tripeptide--D-alanyl-D-alanine ligase
MIGGTANMLWTTPEVAVATGGLCTTSFAAASVSIDSRSIKPGDLFVALKGPSFDGHEFVAAALAQGAAAAIVHRLPAGVAETAPLVRVEDTYQALLKLARTARARAHGQIVAVTGSVGKTGTKEALLLVLGRQGRTSATQGNLNNHWGLPLTLARLPASAAYGVLEMGMNHPGEITPLTRLGRPHVAIITTIESVHSEFFTSTAEIADAKAEIFLGLEPGGTAVLNRDNKHFGRLARAAEDAGVASILDFGKHKDAKVRLVRAELEPEYSQVSASVAGEAVNYRVGIPGQHWVMNSLAVLAAVSALGANVRRAAATLAELSAPKGRGQTTTVILSDGAFTLIDESYNASPVSMTAAIEALGRRQPGEGGRRIAVLGDMLELGEDSPQLHADLLKPLRRNHIDLVFTAGKNMERLWEALPSSLRGGHAASSDRLSPLMTGSVRPGDIVMVKGSAGSRMGGIVQALAALGNDNGAHPRRIVNGH